MREKQVKERVVSEHAELQAYQRRYGYIPGLEQAEEEHGHHGNGWLSSAVLGGGIIPLPASALSAGHVVQHKFRAWAGKKKDLDGIMGTRAGDKTHHEMVHRDLVYP